MKIPFKSVTPQIKKIDYRLSSDGFDIMLKAQLLRRDSVFVKLDGCFEGKVNLECDSCAEDYEEEIAQEVVLYVTDRVIKRDQLSDDEMSYDIVEFPDGVIDIDEVVTSEINSIKLDYHKCKNCNNN